MTAVIVCVPFVLWLSLGLARRIGLLRTLKLAAVSLVVLVVLAGGWYIRNAVLLHGDAIGVTAPGNTQISIKDKRLPAIAVNIVRNYSMELGTPLRPHQQRPFNGRGEGGRPHRQ